MTTKAEQLNDLLLEIEKHTSKISSLSSDIKKLEKSLEKYKQKVSTLLIEIEDEIANTPKEKTQEELNIEAARKLVKG